VTLLGDGLATDAADARPGRRDGDRGCVIPAAASTNMATSPPRCRANQDARIAVTTRKVVGANDTPGGSTIRRSAPRKAPPPMWHREWSRDAIIRRYEWIFSYNVNAVGSEPDRYQWSVVGNSGQ